MSRTILKWLAALVGAVGLVAFEALRNYVETNPLVTGNAAADGVLAIAITTAIIKLGAWIVSKAPAE